MSPARPCVRLQVTVTGGQREGALRVEPCKSLNWLDSLVGIFMVLDSNKSVTAASLPSELQQRDYEERKKKKKQKRENVAVKQSQNQALVMLTIINIFILYQ